MKEIIDLTVTQVRVFAVDAIPIRSMGTKACIERLRSDFRIDEVEIGLPPLGKNSIVFAGGEITEENKTVVINRISIGPRKIILEVAGTSGECSQIYSRLLKSMGAAIRIDLAKLESPIVLSETTQCVATLDFRFVSLLDDSFTAFVYGRVAKAATSNRARASVRPILAEFEISYDVKSKSLIENQVGLLPKRLTIAPRAGTPLEERRYFTSSPFDSDTHLGLIQDLEKAITKKHAAQPVSGIASSPR